MKLIQEFLKLAEQALEVVFSEDLKDSIFERVQNRSDTYIFRQMRSRGFTPSTVIDVGAYEGEWSSMISGIYPNSEYILIEPLESKRKELQSVSLPSKTIYNAVLSDTAGERVTFYEMETGSSIYPESTDVERTETTRQTDTLDNILASHALDSALLKIDAQGAELDILEGAAQSLDDIGAIYLETSLVEYNQGAPRIDEVINYLTGKGYRVEDVGASHRWGGQLAQVDLLFTDSELELTEAWKDTHLFDN